MCSGTVPNMSDTGDSWYVALLGLAESFRQANNIKECVRYVPTNPKTVFIRNLLARCLTAVFSFSPPPVIVARTHLQLGNILHTKTNNQDLAKQHLSQAWYISQPLQGIDEVKFEAASLLAKYVYCDRISALEPVLCAGPMTELGIRQEGGMF